MRFLNVFKSSGNLLNLLPGIKSVPAKPMVCTPALRHLFSRPALQPWQAKVKCGSPVNRGSGMPCQQQIPQFFYYESAYTPHAAACMAQRL